jgi:hypothetical protein
VVLAFFVAFTLYGWRYGFSALPEPAPGGGLDRELVLAEAALPTNNFWFHVRAAQGDSRTLQAAHGGASFATRDLAAARARLLRHFAAAAAAPDRRPPPHLVPQDVSTVRGMAVEARDRAGQLSQQGDSARALWEFVTLWEFEAALVPSTEFTAFFDERGVEFLERTVAAPFQEIVWAAPSLSREEGRKLLRALAAVVERLAPPDHTFARQMLRDAAFHRTLAEPDWGRVSRAFGMATLLIRQDVGRLVTDVLERIVGRRAGGEPNYHAAAHMLRPLEHLLLTLQTWVARPADFERLRQASISLTLVALREGTLPRAEARADWLPGSGSRRSGWRRFWDRPAVWRSLEALPDPRAGLASRQRWVGYLEECRLSLALRLFKDRHGELPERIEELVPAFLDVVPLRP